jgi:hypothetical protein
MDVETGLLRVARIVFVLGLGWVFVCGVLGVVFAFGDEGARGVSAVAFLVGAVGHGIAWAVSWVVRGFAQKKAS